MFLGHHLLVAVVFVWEGGVTCFDMPPPPVPWRLASNAPSLNVDVPRGDPPENRQAMVMSWIPQN